VIAELYPAGYIKVDDHMLNERQQKALIALIWRVRPNEIRDIVCENCPELIGRLHQ
jgi:hypothetical protein